MPDQIIAVAMLDYASMGREVFWVQSDQAVTGYEITTGADRKVIGSFEDRASFDVALSKVKMAYPVEPPFLLRSLDQLDELGPQFTFVPGAHPPTVRHV